MKIHQLYTQSFLRNFTYLIELNDVELVSKRDYISLMIGNKTICYFNFQKTRIRMDFVRGNIKPDGSKSKNFFTLDDPKQISIEGSWEWKNGTKGNVYKVSLDKNFDVDYVKFLIKQNDIDFLRSLYSTKISSPDNYLVLLESDDEILNYLETVSFYEGSYIDISFGGDHSYSSLEKKLSLIQSFLDL